MRVPLLIIPLIHILVWFAIGLDLPVFRQIIGFIYLTFVPGYILLKFLNLTETRYVDIILFSVGLSVAFSMFVGIVINQLFLVIGVLEPLSVVPLTLTLSILTLSLFLVGNRRDLFSGASSWRYNIEISKETIMIFVVLLFLVVSAAIGAIYVSFPVISSPLLSVMIIMIVILFAVSGLSRKLIPSRFHPLIIFAISVALALHILLISKYIVGYDAQLEYQIFKLTIDRGYWSPLPVSISANAPVALSYNSMLSITVLPSIYSALLNIRGELLFKSLYPFVFSLVPVALYRVFKQQMRNVSSLLTTLFIISSPLVYYGVGLLSLNRQMVAMFFLSLSILVLLDKMIAAEKRKVLFAVFSVALIMSHYATAYIYLALILTIYAILRIRGRRDKVLNGSMFLLLFITTFGWYVYTAGPFNSLTSFISQVYSRFILDLTSTAARVSVPNVVPHSVLTLASAFNWTLFLTAHFMILVGFLAVILKSQKAKLDSRYRVLLISSAAMLFLSFAIPNVAPSFDFSRFYQISILFLAPCFVFGVQAFVDSFANLLRWATRRNIFRNTRRIGVLLTCVVLVCYFISQSGFVNFITKAAPQSASLDFDRFVTSSDPRASAGFYSAYIPEQNFFSAVWLSEHAAPESTVYADFDSRQSVLYSYGSISMRYLLLSNTTTPESGSFIYLSSLNIGDGVITLGAYTSDLLNSSEILPTLQYADLVYSNGDGEIWRVTSQFG